MYPELDFSGDFDFLGKNDFFGIKKIAKSKKSIFFVQDFRSFFVGKKNRYLRSILVGRLLNGSDEAKVYFDTASNEAEQHFVNCLCTITRVS